MFVKAIYYREQKTVHYFDEQGNETLYIGGTFAWRCNNPGNLGKPGKRVISTGIGYAQRLAEEPNLFLIFPDKETGEKEQARLLKEVYGKSSISEMMERYAPKKHHNDPVAYTAMITKETGIPGSSIVGQLNDKQFHALLKAMQKKEGFKAGEIKQLGKPKNVALQDMLKQPMANQNIQIKGTTKTVDVKTDEHGSLPPVYSKLMGGEAELVHQQSSCTNEKIGKVSCESTANNTTFSAPYFMAKSNPSVHEVEEKAQRKIHIVKAGESLTSIAGQYPGVTVEALVKENGLKDANKIWERQHLRIPGRGASSSAAHSEQAPPATQAAKAPPTTAGATAPTAAAKPAPTAAANQTNGGAAKPAPTQPAKQETHAASPQAQQKAAPKPPAKTETKAPPPEKKTSPAKSTAKAAVATDQQRTEKNHPVTVLSTPTLEPSGPQWYSRFMGSKELKDLDEEFRPKAVAFYTAMRTAGIGVDINATYRPVERSYLMYHALEIANGGSPVGIKAWPGVAIDWEHRKPDGKPDLVAAKSAAVEMCKKYGLKINDPTQLVGKPKNSNHNKKLAVDWIITGFKGKTLIDNTGAKVKITKFKDLVTVGATYGVIYFSKENMHWSFDGH